MGITRSDCIFLFQAKKSGVDFSKSCMLGRLNLYAGKDDIQSCMNKYGNQAKGLADVTFKDEYSEPLFEILGAAKTDSLDYSDYEKASIIHDLNQPLPDQYKGAFSCIVDGGTIEHVFNFPVAIKSCMDALAVGGHYIGITPANNQMGHGFYQFSPELFYRVFSEENGFRIKQMLISADPATPETDTEWYEVKDPKQVSSRVMLVNNVPLTLRFIAEKIAEKPVFAITPQQSDYTSAWNHHMALQNNDAAMSGGAFKLLYKKLLPYRVKVVLRNIVDLFTKEKVQAGGLGTVNADHYKKVDL